MSSDLYMNFLKAKEHKDVINLKIKKWIDTYNGEPYGNEVEYRSRIVWKLVKKQSEVLIANLIKPFIGNEKIVDLIPVNANDELKKNIYQKLINHFWSLEFNSKRFLKTLSRVIVKEGTAFVKVGWEKKVREMKLVVEPTSEDKVGAVNFINNKIPFEKEIEEKDGKYVVTFKKPIINKPTALVLQNENVFTDPLATSIEDSRFLIIRNLTTKEDMLSNPLLDSELVNRAFENMYKKTNKKYDEDEELVDDITGSDSYVDLRDDLKTIGYYEEASIEPTTIDQKVFLYEYWYKEDGKIKVKYFIETPTDTAVVGSEETDFTKFPFVVFNLFDKEFSIWGESLASLIDEEQKFMTSIVRGIIDNMSSSNNGTKFVKKGALDQINYKRALAGEPIVEVNTNVPLTQAIINGNYNELPGVVWNMLNFIEQQSEGLTGVSRFLQGVNGNEAKMPASNFGSLMSQAQIRLEYFVSNLKEGLKEVFIKWLYMSLDYLSNEDIRRITGINIEEEKIKLVKQHEQEFQVEQLPPDVQQQMRLLIIKEVEDMFDRKDVIYDVQFNIGVDGLKTIKINNLNMFLQQASALVQANAVDSEVIKKLVAKLAKELDYPEIAEDIINYTPQQDPAMVQYNQQMMQIQMQQEMAKAQKDFALAENAKARAEAVKAKAVKEVNSIEHDLASKAIDNANKLTDIDLKKSQIENNLKEKYEPGSE